ncbi:MAG: hypothetical protein AVDCRST_MAG40-523, partial [uncultured Gemmatimonadaceae bacterium]
WPPNRRAARAIGRVARPRAAPPLPATTPAWGCSSAGRSFSSPTRATGSIGGSAPRPGCCSCWCSSGPGPRSTACIDDCSAPAAGRRSRPN